MRRHILSGVLQGWAIIGRAQFRSKRLHAVAASFALTGIDATLRVGTAFVLTAGTAAFALTGQSGALLVSRRVAAAAASFALTGTAATLTITTGGNRVLREDGTFVLREDSSKELRE